MPPAMPRLPVHRFACRNFMLHGAAFNCKAHPTRRGGGRGGGRTSCPGGSTSGEQPLRGASCSLAYSYSGNWIATWQTPISDGSSPLRGRAHGLRRARAHPAGLARGGTWVGGRCRRSPHDATKHAGKGCLLSLCGVRYQCGLIGACAPCAGAIVCLHVSHHACSRHSRVGPQGLG